MPIRALFLQMHRKPQAAAILGICLIFVLICTGLWLCWPMPPEAAVDGQSLAGLPYWKAQFQYGKLYAQPLRVSLPRETLTLKPEDFAVRLRSSAAVRAARKQNGDISLRTYLKADTEAIRACLTDYAARFDTQYRDAQWQLEGKAPILATDCFYPDSPGQTLQVTLGVPESHLDVDAALEEILTAFSQPLSRSGDLLAIDVVPEKIPKLPNAAALYRQVYLAPVDDAPDFRSGGILPGSYGQSVDKAQLASALESAEYGQTISIPLTYTPPEKMGEDILFQDVLGAYETRHNTSENRNNNLRLVCQALDGYILQPGETFSYNGVVGERTTERGYLPAPAFSGNRLVNDVGGGVCQGSTTLYNCVLLADLQVVFRACHGAKVSYVPLGLDATVNYLTTDFKFRNQFRFPVKIQAEMSDGFVKMKLLGTDEKDYYVKMEALYGDDDLAIYARSYKCKYDKQTNELISRDVEAYSTYYKKIG